MRLLLFTFYLAATLPGADAVTLKGRVLDSSRAAIPRASVLLHSLQGLEQWSTRTGPAGEYELAAVPAGRYRLEVRASGFATISEAVSLEASRTRDVELRPDVVSSRVVVTAASAAQSLDEAAKAVDVIDSDELARRAEFSVAEALRTVPGLRVQQLGGPGSLVRIQVRGLRPWDTGVLIDGFRFRDAASPQGEATAYLSELLVTNLDRIEVLRGSGSSLYGTNAIGGAINLVTDQGGGPLHGEVAAEGGGLGMARGLGKLAGGAWNDRVRYSAGVTHLNVTRGVDGDDRARNTSGHASAQVVLGPTMSLSGRLLTADSFAQLNVNPAAGPLANLPGTGIVPAIPLAPDQVARREQGLPVAFGNATFVPSLNDPDASRSARLRSGLVTFTHRIAPSLSYRVNYQGLTSERDNPNGPGGPGFQSPYRTANRFDGRLDTVQARADWAPAPAHLLSGGYEFEREGFDNRSRDENPNLAARANARTSIEQRSHALFAQEQSRWLGDRLLVSLSGRVQRFDLSRPTFEGGAARYVGLMTPTPPNAYTGDASVAYLVAGTGTKLRAHVGNGYRAPSLYERFGTTFFGGSFSPIGDPRLAPERSLAMDAGLDQYLANSRVRVSATAFYTRLREVIGFDFSGLINRATDPFGRGSGYFNTGGGLARGIELGVQATPTRGLTLATSYTHTNADERSPAVLFTVRSLRIYDHAFTLTATQRFGRRWDATFDLLAASESLGPLFAGTGSRAFAFEGPRKADLVLAYTLPLTDRQGLRLFTRVENLFDQRYFEEGFRTPGRWATVGLRLQF